ncbi:lipoamide acyltransferase component of branched-chain alpha-keto acid dehydrogenase complex, mitochondrial-like isoform X1 [Mangifera indica]|uniref:lipoamide acyltransferase component of branched-chain alpha-keto acid dehydrogenase complex, mitochondrial-like isoform X1 n=1 Tax=Mangifera indica TaxID=29780 RepID=UPI001CFB7D49|nr:lipoamide acyltransferase component of branched-chain alpha-keto acid dehydrogenase complex, mitochondrial-like isoform X1 [Mangifera indica]
MIGRRIWQKRPWSRNWSSGRTLLCPFTYHESITSSLPGLKAPVLGFLTGHASLLLGSANNNLKDFSILCAVNRCSYSSHALADVPVGGVVDVPLAQTGEGIAECELLKWFVKEGDQVDEFQPLCEVQSDKATIEITSRYKGKVAKILHVPGNIVKVGETLLKMVVEECLVSAPSSDVLESAKPPGSKDMSLPNSKQNENAMGGILCTPAVRHLAKQYGVNLNDVRGSGKDRRILKEDVVKYSAQKGIVEASSASDSSDSEEGNESFAFAEVILDDKTVPLRGYQRTMVKTMSMAAKVPHFHYVEEINCDALVDLKTSFQNNNSDPNVKYTFLPLLLKSLSMALSKYPFMNSCFNEESLEVILRGSHNIGVAMATPNGLVVPNIKNVQSLSIAEITKELSRLQQSSRDNKLSPGDISGGTITLSNIGAIGGKFGSPLVNLPEVAIIALGRIQRVPHFADDGIVYPTSIVTVNIGADHRVLDGATVARFCNEWKQFIENPELLMLHMR